MEESTDLAFFIGMTVVQASWRLHCLMLQKQIFALEASSVCNRMWTHHFILQKKLSFTSASKLVMVLLCNTGSVVTGCKFKTHLKQHQDKKKNTDQSSEMYFRNTMYFQKHAWVISFFRIFSNELQNDPPPFFFFF